MPKVMVLGSGIFGRWLGHEGGALINVISAFMRETPESQLIPSVMEDTVRSKQSASWKRTSPEPDCAVTLILEFKPPELWEVYFCSSASQSVVFCYSSPNRLQQALNDLMCHCRLWDSIQNVWPDGKKELWSTDLFFILSKYFLMIL